MDKIKGVITGDIIKSSAIQIEYRNCLLESIRKVVDELNVIEPLKIEFFRGDSFQMIINNPENAMLIAILLRAGIKSHTPKDCKKAWDARLSLGVGTISYHADNIVLSDGEAFQYSGRELDDIGKRCLIVKTRWPDVLFVAEWRNWIIPLVIFVSHTLMDYIKVECMKKDVTSFIIDQLVHITIIVVLWSLLFGNSEYLCQEFFRTEWNDMNIWTVITAYLLILKPTSVFLSLFIRRWTPSETTENSLPNAGEWIGYFERILILTFILTGTPESIGFLLAAKSIFRFGELSKAQEIKTTEYVMIGTLASFTIAILIGFAVLQFIK